MSPPAPRSCRFAAFAQHAVWQAPSSLTPGRAAYTAADADRPPDVRGLQRALARARPLGGRRLPVPPDERGPRGPAQSRAVRRRVVGREFGRHGWPRAAQLAERPHQPQRRLRARMEPHRRVRPLRQRIDAAPGHRGLRGRLCRPRARGRGLLPSPRSLSRDGDHPRAAGQRPAAVRLAVPASHVAAVRAGAPRAVRAVQRAPDAALERAHRRARRRRRQRGRRPWAGRWLGRLRLRRRAPRAPAARTLSAVGRHAAAGRSGGRRARGRAPRSSSARGGSGLASAAIWCC